MKFFAIKKSNIFIAGIAACLTLLTRVLTYTPDCNLFIMAITFISIYTLTYIITYAVGKLRAFCTMKR